MSSWFPEWFRDFSVYFWLIGMSFAMFVFTQDSDPAYLDLWLVTLLYGLWGFAAEKLKNQNARRTIQVILLVLYSLIVIGVIIATPTRRHWAF